MGNEIVQYKNELNTVGLREFFAVEQDLFMALCYKMKQKGTEEVVLTFDELRALSGYSKSANEHFVNDLKSMNEKLQAIKVNFDDGVKYVSLVLFPTFIIDRETKTVTIQVNHHFAFLLNNFGIGGKWTGFELAVHSRLNSRYSKAMFRLLKQWRVKGGNTWGLETFRELLEIPESYDMRKITQKVLAPIMSELGMPQEDGTPPPFSNLQIKKNQNGKGRAITSLTFSFDRENTEKELIKEGENKGKRIGRNTVRNKKTEILPGWVGQTGTETPLSPEDEAAVNARIAKLKSTRTKKE